MLVFFGAIALVALLVWSDPPSHVPSSLWQALTFFALLGGVAVAYWQLRQFRKANNSERTIEEITAVQTEEWSDKEREVFRAYMDHVRDSERWLEYLKSVTGKEPHEISSETQRKVFKIYMDDIADSLDWSVCLGKLSTKTLDEIRAVARRYERIGNLMKMRLLDEHLLLRVIHAPIYRLWWSLRPWMENERQLNKAGVGYYFLGFRYVAKKSYEFHKDHHSTAPISLYHPDDDSVLIYIYPLYLKPGEYEELFRFSDSGKQEK